MTEEQQKALENLLAIECKVAAKNEDGKECDEGPWCEARRKIVTAFGLTVSEESETEEVEEEEEEQEEG